MSCGLDLPFPTRKWMKPLKLKSIESPRCPIFVTRKQWVLFSISSDNTGLIILGFILKLIYFLSKRRNLPKKLPKEADYSSLSLRLAVKVTISAS